MATISLLLAQVKNQIDVLLPPDQIFRICRTLGYRWRNRMLDPVVTVHLLVLQLLAQVSLNALRLVGQIAVTAQALCKAKQRLPLGVLFELLACSAPQGPAKTLWRGFVVYIADAMSILTPDAPELAKRYGKSRNQQGISMGFPTPKILGLMDLEGGYIHKIIALPWARQEGACLSRLYKSMAGNAILLGDRGLAGFAQLAMLAQSGHQGCFRLARNRVVFGRGTRRHYRVRRLGRQDVLVVWKAGPVRPSWVSPSRWETMRGQELHLRQIAFRICRKGCRTHWAWIITTLLDPQMYPAQEIVDLYTKRWEIEVCFRDLKQTLGMRRISAKSVAGARKEIMGFIILYNLIQRIRKRASITQGVASDRISFTDAMIWLRWSVSGQALVRLITNPHRKRRSPPRRIKTGRKRFAQLKGPRHKLSLPPVEVKI